MSDLVWRFRKILNCVRNARVDDLCGWRFLFLRFFKSYSRPEKLLKTREKRVERCSESKKHRYKNYIRSENAFLLIDEFVFDAFASISFWCFYTDFKMYFLDNLRSFFSDSSTFFSFSRNIMSINYFCIISIATIKYFKNAEMQSVR